jgi:hypothetical protein
MNNKSLLVALDEWKDPMEEPLEEPLKEALEEALAEPMEEPMEDAGRPRTHNPIVDPVLFPWSSFVNDASLANDDVVWYWLFPPV